MSAPRHDRAAVDAAFEAFLAELAAINDEQLGRTRAAGVSDHD